MFCRIYITGKEISESLILNFLSNIFEIPISGGMYVENENFSISVDSNDEYDSVTEKNFPDGFLYFKLLIGIDFVDNNNAELAIEVTGRILKYLWINNYSAVASCSYEEDLIEKGGYNNRNVPWPQTC